MAGGLCHLLEAAKNVCKGENSLYNSKLNKRGWRFYSWIVSAPSRGKGRWWPEDSSTADPLYEGSPVEELKLVMLAQERSKHFPPYVFESWMEATGLSSCWFGWFLLYLLRLWRPGWPKLWTNQQLTHMVLHLTHKTHIHLKASLCRLRKWDAALAFMQLWFSGRLFPPGVRFESTLHDVICSK